MVNTECIEETKKGIIRMKLFNKYKFSDKSQTLGGIISLVMGLAATVIFMYGVYISFKAHGNAGLEVGSIGLLSLMFAVMGTFIGLISLKERDKFYTLSKVGSLLCGILAIFLISICFLGF